MTENNKEKESQIELKKTLGLPTLIAISLTSMAGSGMFVGQSIVAEKAGAASIFAWVLLSVVSFIMTLIFAELVSIYPTAGGIYEYSKRSFGYFPAFMAGWVTWLVNTISPCVLLLAAFDIVLPESIFIPILPFLSPPMIKLILSIVMIIILNYIAFRGIDASAVILIFFAIITVGIVLIIFLPAIGLINYDNYTPFFEKEGLFTNLGLILFALFFIIEGNFGWESATFLAEETKNPKKQIPKALIISSLIIIILNTLVGFIPIGIMSIGELIGVGNGLFFYMSSIIYGPQFEIFFSVLLVITFIGAAAGNIVGSPRLILAMARDKLFVNSLDAVHPKYRTPYKAIVFQTLVAIIVLLIAFSDYIIVLKILAPLGIIMYTSVLFVFMVLRIKINDSERGFKAPFPWWFAGFLVMFFLSVISMDIIISGFETFRIVLSFIFFGVPIYLLLMFYYDPDVIIRLNNSFSFLSLITERMMIPKKIDRSIFAHIGDIKDKKVFEYGCSVGTLTKELASQVGENGRIYALDVSFNSLKIAKKRLEKKGYFNVSFIHDIHQLNRVHSSVPMVDSIVSIAMLGYIQDIRKVLKEMHDILPEGGKVFFVDYVNLFKILPNVSWLSNPNKLQEIYEEEGFSVKVDIIKGAFWDYVYVYGIKTDYHVPFV